MNELRKIGIHSIGTIRILNTAGFSKVCITDKELSQLGSRDFVEYITSFEGIVDPGIRIIRWDDNNIFNLGHTFGSGYPAIRRERWYHNNSNTSQKFEVDMPNAMGQYDKCMGAWIRWTV